MKVGMLGSGEVGQALGAGFVSLDHDVCMGSRDPGQPKIRNWMAKVGSHASAGTFAEAAGFGDLLVLATAWGGTSEAIQLAGTDRVGSKIVIDATNPLQVSSAGPVLAMGFTDSGGEQVQRWLPRARVVKAFNTVGSAHMFRPRFPGGPPDMFICGNDAEAKRVVSGLLQDFGWAVIDSGAIDSSRYLEPLAMLWIVHYLKTKSGAHAFKLLRK
jgi:predicted dinucleotide-binding enzyme